MRMRFIIAVLATLFSTQTVFADPTLVTDPDKTSGEFFDLITRAKFDEAATAIANAIGKQDAIQPMAAAFKVLEGKRFDFGKKVLDRDFNGALRQIVYYAYFENAGFIYYRFTFKMTSKGWLLTNFFFKDSLQDLFPKDFLDVSMQ